MKNFAVITIVLLFSLKTFAVTDLFNSSDFWPTVGPSDYFSVSNSRTLLQWQPTLGLFNTYAWKPIRLTSGNMIDHAVIHFVSAGIGITDWAQMGITFPFVSLNYFTDPNVAGATEKNHSDMGDLRVDLKFHLMDGLAIETFGTAPTGRSSHYVGDDSFTGGGKLIAEVQPLSRLKLALNAGAAFQQHVLFTTSLDYSERFLYGAGATVRLNHQLDFLVEATGATSLQHFFADRPNSPAEIDAGLKWRIPDSGLTLEVGGGTCMVCNAKAPTARAILGIDYRLETLHFAQLEGKEKIEVTQPLTETGYIATKQPLTFEFSSAQISDEGSKTLGQVADMISAHPNWKQLRVEGHSDSVGGRNKNRRISLRRAEHVIRYLRYRGVPEGVELIPTAMGEKNPLAPNDTESGRALNRQVVFKVMK